MSNKTVIDVDNPEWTDADFGRAKPTSQLPSDIATFFPKTRGRQKTPTKVALSIRLSPEVVEHYKATGPGWQARIDEVLKKAAGLDQA
ncbi:BrnA antitoxin family protein [Rhizobium sp. Leaf262]|uniref:BrnA antitoxin family protein n=1 Tax=Rhizobium sp. Leaf262 TaxID=1736312 RepID=UPI000B302942|nr:BrnA antitoxin family protein [Rhizobium sp. Leaf262]